MKTVQLDLGKAGIQRAVDVAQRSGVSPEVVRQIRGGTSYTYLPAENGLRISNIAHAIENLLNEALAQPIDQPQLDASHISIGRSILGIAKASPGSKLAFLKFEPLRSVIEIEPYVEFVANDNATYLVDPSTLKPRIFINSLSEFCFAERGGCFLFASECREPLASSCWGNRALLAFVGAAFDNEHYFLWRANQV